MTARPPFLCITNSMWSGVRFFMVKPNDCAEVTGPDDEIIVYSDPAENEAGSGLTWLGMAKEFFKMFTPDKTNDF